MQFVKERGEINPSHMKDAERNRPDGFIGSEVKRRCCELREAGDLVSNLKGKFVIFTLPKDEETEEPFPPLITLKQATIC